MFDYFVYLYAVNLRNHSDPETATTETVYHTRYHRVPSAVQ